MNFHKKIFDAECGAPNPLVTLANNYGANGIGTAGSIGVGASGAQAYIRSLIPGLPTAPAELMAEEYLAKITEQMPMPSTFNMAALLKSEPFVTSPELYEGHWREALGTSTDASLKWEKDYSARHMALRPAVSDGWTGEYLDKVRSIGENHFLEFASEYLSRFDGLAANGGKIGEEWANDFLQIHPPASAEAGKDLASSYYQFEEEWRNIQREQEKYHFTATNPFTGEDDSVQQGPSDSLLLEAKTRFASGNLSDAILLYEAHLQRNPNDSESWCSLGLCHSENEQDSQAIKAFRTCLKLNPTNRQALLALSVSLSNEGLDGAATIELDRWIHAFNKDALPTEGFEAQPFSGALLDELYFKKVEGRFIATDAPLESERAELLNAMGVLYNLNRSYDKAIDCIQRAIHIKPEDSVLWNRLGATLANSDRSVEAIGAYRQALQLYPTYVRARDALQHFLTALLLQKSRENSDIWMQMRSACIRLSDDPEVPFSELMRALELRDAKGMLQLFPAISTHTAYVE